VLHQNISSVTFRFFIVLSCNYQCCNFCVLLLWNKCLLIYLLYKWRYCSQSLSCG